MKKQRRLLALIMALALIAMSLGGAYAFANPVVTGVNPVYLTEGYGQADIVFAGTDLDLLDPAAVTIAVYENFENLEQNIDVVAASVNPTHINAQILPGLIPGAYHYRVVSDVYGDISGQGIQFSVVQPFQVTGAVLDPPGSQAVPGAGVTIRNQNWSRVWNTGAEQTGRFFLAGPIPPGSYLLDIYPPLVSSYSPRQNIPVDISGAAGQDLGSFSLAYPTVVGHVYMPDGTTPAEGAYVMAHTPNWSFQVGWGTDNNGRYSIGSLPGYGEYIIEAMPPWGNTTVSKATYNVIYSQGDPLPYNIDLTLRNPVLVGRVVDIGDTGVGNANVSIHSSDWSVMEFSPPTNNQGGFSFGDLNDGTYILEVRSPWERSDLIASENLTVTVSGGVVTNVSGDGAALNSGVVEVTLNVGQKTISGNVTKTGGSPVADALVIAFRERGNGFAQAMTGAGGAYTMTVSGGEWMVTVQPDYGELAGQAPEWAFTGLPRRVAFESGSNVPENETVDLEVVAAGCTVRGRVVDPDGDPVTSGYVDVRSKDGAGNGVGLRQEPGGNQFNIKVPPGSYTVSVFPSPDSGYGSPAPRSVTVSGANPLFDLETLTLQEKNAAIRGKITDENGSPLEGVAINAWQPGGTGFSSDTTDAGGEYVVKVTPGTWELMVMPDFTQQSESQWVYSQPPRRVTVNQGETKTGIDFEVTYANCTISGKVVDGDGQVVNDLYGFAFAHPEGGQASTGFGAPIQGGTFNIKVPAGIYTVGGGLPPGSDYSLGGTTQIDLSAPGSTGAVTLQILENDAVITGSVVDSEGNPINDVIMEVFAVNGSGSFQKTSPVNGSYNLNVSQGNWHIGYFVDPSQGYSSSMPSDNSISVGAGENKTYDITLQSANSTISGTVTDEGGEPVAYAWVAAEEESEDEGLEFATGVSSGPDGTFTIKVPPGQYEVGASLPPSRGKINPQFQLVTAAANTEVNVNLVFKDSDATISGSVTFNGSGRRAFVHGWSDKGGFTEVETDSGGSYSLNVAGGDTWHISASCEDQSGYYLSGEQSVNVTGGAVVNLALAEVDGEIPDTVSVTFDAGTMKIITLENGTRIQIPAGALETSGSVTVTATPRVGLRKQKSAVPVGIGYDLVALNSQQQPITHTFHQDVTITIPYTDSDLTDLGITAEELVPAYWDTNTGTWKRLENAVVDTQNKTITYSVNHFTEFGIITSGAQGGSGDDGGNDGGDNDGNDGGNGGGNNGGNNGGKTAAAPSDAAGGMSIAASSGGTVESSDGMVSVNVPAGGLTADANLKIEEVADTANVPAGSFMLGSKVYEVTLSQGSIKAGSHVTLTFDYALAGVNEEQVNAYYWNGSNWVCLGGRVVNGKYEVNVSHFTKFAVMANLKLPVLNDIKSHWAYSEIKRLVGMEATRGYPDGTFKPDNSITRAEFAKIIAQAMGWPAKSGDLSFADASDIPAWAGGGVAAAVDRGVIRGYEDNTFRPNQLISRSEIAVMVVRALGGEIDPARAGSPGFSDSASVPAWARGYVSVALDKGIIKGKPGNRFAPADNATRAESAVMLIRMLENLGI